MKYLMWLKPKGFWGYVGVALFVLLSAATAYQQVYSPYMILKATEVAEVQAFITEILRSLVLLQHQCSMN